MQINSRFIAPPRDNKLAFSKFDLQKYVKVYPDEECGGIWAEKRSLSAASRLHMDLLFHFHITYQQKSMMKK
jgi:hypothetical protein